MGDDQERKEAGLMTEHEVCPPRLPTSAVKLRRRVIMDKHHEPATLFTRLDHGEFGIVEQGVEILGVVGEEDDLTLS